MGLIFVDQIKMLTSKLNNGQILCGARRSMDPSLSMVPPIHICCSKLNQNHFRGWPIPDIGLDMVPVGIHKIVD